MSNIRSIYDNTYHFNTVFNTSTGEYIRAFDVSSDPFMAEFPHLIDVGIMGHCEHGKSGLCLKAGIKCYQNGLNANKPNMTLENYKRIVDEGKDKLLEIALGGAGDPDMHENFEEILKYTRKNNIVPNFTTSGFGMTVDKAGICKKYCGAVAVSMYSRLKDIPENLESKSSVNFTLGYSEIEDSVLKDKNIAVIDEIQSPNYTLNAINMLLDAGVKTNIHYVLSNTTIDEAIVRLKYNVFPKGINAVIFLLHKPVGLGTYNDVLNADDPKVKMFFDLIDNNKYNFKVGFDSCSIPGIINFCNNIDKLSIDTCEGARFSMYIDSQMTALPCSFDNQDKKYAVRLSKTTGIIDAWNSPEFNRFRDKLRVSCSSCNNKELCMGGCTLQPSIILCDKKHN